MWEITLYVSHEWINCTVCRSALIAQQFLQIWHPFLDCNWREVKLAMQELHHETASQWVDMIHHSPWFNTKHFASPQKTLAARRNSPSFLRFLLLSPAHPSRRKKYLEKRACQRTVRVPEISQDPAKTHLFDDKHNTYDTVLRYDFVCLLYTLTTKVAITMTR